jgi:hypothetical protein
MNLFNSNYFSKELFILILTVSFGGSRVGDNYPPLLSHLKHKSQPRPPQSKGSSPSPGLKHKQAWPLTGEQLASTILTEDAADDPGPPGPPDPPGL